MIGKGWVARDRYRNDPPKPAYLLCELEGPRLVSPLYRPVVEHLANDRRRRLRRAVALLGYKVIRGAIVGRITAKVWPVRFITILTGRAVGVIGLATCPFAACRPRSYLITMLRSNVVAYLLSHSSTTGRAGFAGKGGWVMDRCDDRGRPVVD
jgi:hypothetical protein